MMKMTYVEALNAAIASAALTEEVKTKLSALKEQMEKKSAKSGEKKLTKTQTANEGIRAEILSGMEFNTPYTVSELIKFLPCLKGLSNQKVSVLVHGLVESGAIVRSVEKGKAFFTKVA